MTLTLSWVFRIILSLLIGLAAAFCFRREWRYEQQVAQTGCTAREGKKRDTVVWLSPWFLPILIVVLWLASLLSSGPAISTAFLMESSTQLVALLTLYFGVLMVLLPLLRKTISARACAALWLLPVFVYYGQYVFRGYVPPLVVLMMVMAAETFAIVVMMIVVFSDFIISVVNVIFYVRVFCIMVVMLL